MKHKHFLLTVFCIVIFILSGQNVWAQVPQTMSYQGVLTSAKGTLVPDGKYTITFKLYTAAEGGTALWSETQTVVVKNGLFNVALGSANALDVAFDKPYWLAITIGEGSEVSQRMQLTSSAYSLHARSVADSAVTSSKIASGQVVRSINAMTDEVTLAAGENVAITQEGNLLIISANLDQLSIEDSEDELGAAADLDKLSTGDIKPELKAQGPNKGKVIASKGDVEIVIDKDNDETDRTFSVRKDGESKKSKGTELFRVQEDGKVGIGTTDPIAPLHIANGALFLEDNFGDIWFKEVADLSAYVTAGSPSPTDPVFRIFTPPFGDEGLLMSVLANGDVGIGTAEPTEKLDVVGNIKAIGLEVVNDIQTGGRVLASAYSSNSPLIFEAPVGVERARIDDITGNFGIGTMTPTHRLHMVGGMFKVENDEPLVLFHKPGIGQRGWIGYPNFGAAGITIFNDISARELRLLDNGSLFYNGKVGIGTTSPAFLLDINSPGNGTIAIRHENTGGTAALRFYEGSTLQASIGVSGSTNSFSPKALTIESANLGLAGDILFRTSGVTRMVIKATGGLVGIGTTSPTAFLSVNGSANKPGGGSWGVFSDIRLKKDISPFGDGLRLVNQINPIWFRYNGKAGLPTDKKYVGVIAQEIEKIAPYLIEKKMVNEGGAEEEYMEYDGSAMDFILINAIKDQQKIIAAQNAELQRMKTQLAEFDGMKSRMAKIEAALQKMEILTAKKESEKKSSTNETALVVEGSE